MQTILGANGTIGSLLAKELTNYTNNIRLVSRNPKKINENDELYEADLRDETQIDKAVAGSEVVYLLVGLEYNIKVWEAEWPKIMNATLDACKKHNAKLVFFDNVYMYDVNDIGNMTEESKVNPSSRKGKVRMEIAQMLLNETKNNGLQALIARAADFYGPNNKTSMLIEIVYKNFKKGKAANWFVNAEKKHSFTYTPDAAKATAILGNTPDAFNQVWHLPTQANPLTTKEITALFAKEMKVKNKIMILPAFMIKILGLFIPIMKEMPEMLYQYDRDYIFDSTKFNKKFNFTPTSYEEGIREIVKISN